MQAQQLIYAANFSLEEKLMVAKMNHARVLADQAELCAKSCLKDSIGLATLRDGGFELKADLEREREQLFNKQEADCVDNCVYKLFATERVMRAYLPTRMNKVKVNQSQLEKRINNPNEEHGPYFF